jgi:ribosomal protein S15P/S13E
MTKLKPTVDLGYPTESLGDIPSFNTIEEEAEWWDTHDTTDFQHLFTPVQIKIGGELAEQIASHREDSKRDELDEKLTLRLDQSDRAALTKFAKRKGIGPSTLVRMWIKEHLEEEAAREAKAS